MKPLQRFSLGRAFSTVTLCSLAGLVTAYIFAAGPAVTFLLSGANLSTGATVVIRSDAIDGKFVQFGNQAASSPPTAPASTPTPTPTPTPGPSWTTVFSDQFDSGGVPSHWSLYDGPYGSTPNNCAVPSHATVSGGSLNMLMAYETSGKCGASWYTAGMMDNTPAGKSVDQRLTLRWRVTGTDLTTVRSHRNIPMRWSSVDPWYQGESDYCEGSSLTSCSTYLHYGNSTTTVSHDYNNIDMTAWHTWRFEHRDHIVKVYIDDLTTPVWTYTGTETTIPSVMRRVVLQQECRASGCPSSTLSGNTETIQIDWITAENPS